MRVAFQAINGVGLGHLVRVLAIAEEVRRLHPDAALLVLTNAPDTSMLTRAGFDFVRLPLTLTEPHTDPDRVRRALPTAVEHAALAAALDAFRPDLVVFDTHGPIPLAQHAASLGARSVLVQREVRPEVLARFLARGGAAAFDRLVFPHEEGEVDLAGTEHLPVVSTGPVVRKLDTTLPRGVRPPRVVVTAGGGGQPIDAQRFLRAAADAHMLARARIPRLTTLLVAGPYGELPRHLERIPGLSATGACAHLPALMARAALVVSQAGYNSVAEIRALEKPAILVPAHKRSEDQSLRAKRLVALGAAVIAKPEARSIADHLESLLLSPGALAAMAEAHRRRPLSPGNRAAAAAVLRPVRAAREVERVVLVAHAFEPGGTQHALAKGLVAEGLTVRVYSARRFGPEVADLPQGTVRRLYAPQLELWCDLLITLDALLADAPDAIHLGDTSLAPWVPALRAAFPAAVTHDALGGDPRALVDGWNASLRRTPGTLPLSGFAAALAGEVDGAASAREIAVREALRAATSGVALVRLGQEEAMARRKVATHRTASFASIVKNGGVVRLRALKVGAKLLVDALAECAALGHAPLVEMTLGRFVAPDFQAHGLPLIRGAQLVHDVPAEDGAALAAGVAALPSEAFPKIVGLRLTLSREAKASPRLTLVAAREADALQRRLVARGVDVAVAPELAQAMSTSGVRCPCCDGDFPAFLPYGLRPRPAQCPGCLSLERHRLLMLYLREETTLFVDPLRVLHVAPEPALQRIFRRQRNIDYLSVDLRAREADLHMDLTALTFPDESFDVVLAVHVLEHIGDDRRAMGEIFRVMKPGGWAVLQVPVDARLERTVEDPSAVTPADRERVHGQHDHMRRYGRDYRERLEQAGFLVTMDDYASRLTHEVVQRFGLDPREKIHRCVKPCQARPVPA